MIITMAGRLSECILLSYRTPAASVLHLVPEGLELVTRDKWAFWNIVACRIEDMRPKGMPRLMGVDYHHVAYRLYVRSHTAGGQTVDGLYFLRSDVNHNLLASCGNLLSDFRFYRAHIALRLDANACALDVTRTENGLGDAHLRASAADHPSLEEESCFDSFEEASVFLKYRPLGLSCKAGRLKLAEVFRDDSQWHETPLHIIEARWVFLDHLGQRELRFELATRVCPIDYRWRLGRKELLGRGE